MDTTIYQDESVSYHGSQAMMENCNRLESIILSAIPKVNALIQIFFRLMEVPEKEGFPTFENVIKYV